jgi:hypothetical protein
MFSRQQHLLLYYISKKFVLASDFKVIRYVLSAPESKLDLTAYIGAVGSFFRLFFKRYITHIKLTKIPITIKRRIVSAARGIET